MTKIGTWFATRAHAQAVEVLRRPGKSSIAVLRKPRGSFGLDNPTFVESVTLKLPFPPSANRLWRIASGGHGYKSPEYCDWLTQARFGLAGQPRGRVKGAYELTVSVARPDGRRRDLDNLIKPIGDFLQGAGYIENDSLCERLEIKWARQDADVIVTIETARGAPLEVA